MDSDCWLLAVTAYMRASNTLERAGASIQRLTECNPRHPPQSAFQTCADPLHGAPSGLPRPCCSRHPALQADRRIRLGRHTGKGQQDKTLHLKIHACSWCSRPRTADLWGHKRTHQKSCFVGPPIELCQPGTGPPFPARAEERSHAAVALPSAARRDCRHIELPRANRGL